MIFAPDIVFESVTISLQLIPQSSSLLQRPIGNNGKWCKGFNCSLLKESILVDTQVSAATLAVKLNGASKTLEALGNCSLTFYPQQQAIHSLKLNPQQPRWFSL